MRVLVTGGSGFVGRSMIAALRERGHDVVSAAPSLGDDGHLPLDLIDEQNVRAVLEIARPDWIVHLAAQTFVPTAAADPLGTYRVNVLGTAYVLEAARALRDMGGPSPRVLFASSAEVYGPRAPADMPLRETLATAPANPYAASKAAAESLVTAAHRAYGLDTIVARAFNHIGPGQDDRFVVPAFARRIAHAAASGDPLVRVGNVEVERDILDVRDVVRAYIGLLEAGRSGDTYNVARGQAVKIREILRRLVLLADVAVEIREDPALVRPSDVPTFVGDATKLRAETGWEPQIALATSLAEVYALAREREARESAREQRSDGE